MKKQCNIIRKFAEHARRENEIKTYGKIISLRPSCTHKSKKIYSRKTFNKSLLCDI